MVINEILGNLRDRQPQGKNIDSVGIEWYEQDKKLLKKVSADGEEIGIRLKPDSAPIADGDILYEDDKKIIAVSILPCELTEVRVSTMEEMGRLCFELGNRHLSVAIGDGKVTVPYDEPTYLYLKKLGFEANKKKEIFTGYTVCHGHSH